MANTPHAKRPWWMPERKPHTRRVNPNTSIYNSKKWRNMARLHKMRNPLCVECESQGISTPVQVTDHIVPINQGGAAYDWKNLQSLCNRCHAAKSGREAHSNGDRGTDKA